MPCQKKILSYFWAICRNKLGTLVVMIICNCFWYFCCNSIQLTFIWVHNKDVQYSYYIVDVSAIIRPSKSWSLHECSSPRLSLSPKTYCIRKYLEEMQSTTLSRLFLMSGLKTLTWKHGSHWNILTIFSSSCYISWVAMHISRSWYLPFIPYITHPTISQYSF